jgi:hypothetical protein
MQLTARRTVHRSHSYTDNVKRQDTDFASMDNQTLKFTVDLLYLHNSDYLESAMSEIISRIENDEWLDLNAAPPTQENLPAWLKIFPFNLLWKQRPG